MRLLLDAHLSLLLAIELQRRHIEAVQLARWLDGHYRQKCDSEILDRAREDNRVLVTYDQEIEVLLRSWSASGRHHAGVILIDDKTICQHDIGGQLRALVAFVAEHGDEDWTDQVRYLPRPR